MYFRKADAGNFLKRGITLRSGWSSVEDWGVWALGDRAVITLQKPASPTIKLLTLKVRPLLSPKIISQTFKLYLDGRFIGIFEISGDKELEVELSEDRNWLKDSIEIEFILNPLRPADSGLGDDSRLLSIGLISAEFN